MLGVAAHSADDNDFFLSALEAVYSVDLDVAQLRGQQRRLEPAS